jgi:hypothetical protein
MGNTVKAAGLPEEHRAEKAAKVEQANMPGKRGKGAGTGSPASPSPDSEQSARDLDEKNKHPASEKALDSSQDKNPIPPGSTAT